MSDDVAEREVMTFVVEPESSGERLDSFLVRQLKHLSRTFLRQAIKLGGVGVNGQPRKPAYTLRGGETITVQLPNVPADGPRPEEILLDVLHEDDDLVVINKPTGMVVHPAKGHWSGTLTSALAHHFRHLSSVGGAHRPGIVHRLDRDTSGVIVVAKNDQAHIQLVNQFEQRSVEKEYFAISRGQMDRDRDWIEQPIGAHPYHRERMAIRDGHMTSREARTFFEVRERFAGYLSLSVFPKTGRTHQIRVHLTHVGCPVLCDTLYSGYRQVTVGELTGNPRHAHAAEVALDRLALHARRIAFAHPRTRERLEVQAPLPAEFARVLELLRQRGASPL